MEFIDFIFSSIYPSLIIWIIFIGLGILVFYFWNTVYHEKLKLFIVVFFPFIVFFILLLIWAFGSFGNVKNVTSIIVVDNKLGFIDYNYRKVKRMGDDYNISRLYLADIYSGEIIDRKRIGIDAKILGVEAKNILIGSKGGELRIYNTENKTIKYYDAKNNQFLNWNNYKLEKLSGFSLLKKNNELNYYDSLTNSMFSVLIEDDKLINSKISYSIKYKEFIFFNIKNAIFCLDLTEKQMLWYRKY
jgi:energy-coupling factor transporter transmembrane protein EcfT